MSLAGGSGWAVLDFNFRTADLRVYGSGNHTQSLASGAPLLVMDMYEHAYHMDYGASAAAYIEAFLANVRWEEVNRRYERALKAFHGAATLSPDRPLFDVTFLGLGPEGHIASLFPGTAVLSERRHWVGAVVGATAEPRITLTYPALESSRAIAFLVTGAAKRPVLERLLKGDPGLPATHLHPLQGTLHLFVDGAAAPREVP